MQHAAVTNKRQPSFLDNAIHPILVDWRLRELLFFFQQLGSLFKAGIPLGQALEHLERQATFRHLRKFLPISRRAVQAGRPLSEAMERYPHLFSEVQIEMVRAGEVGGVLQDAVYCLVTYLEWELELRRCFSRRTLYAKLVFVSAVLIIPTMFGWVMGTDFWQLMLTDLVTILHLLGMGLLAVSIAALFRTLMQRWTPLGDLYDRIKWRLPGIGVITRKFALARFARTFAMLYRAGLPMSSAVRTALESSGNRVLAGLAPTISGSLEAGRSLALTFGTYREFPEAFLERLNTGEHSGDLEAMMNHAANSLIAEAETGAMQSAYIFSEVFFLLVAFIVLRGTIR